MMFVQPKEGCLALSESQPEASEEPVTDEPEAEGVVTNYATIVHPNKHLLSSPFYLIIRTQNP